MREKWEGEEKVNKGGGLKIGRREGDDVKPH